MTSSLRASLAAFAIAMLSAAAAHCTGANGNPVVEQQWDVALETMPSFGVITGGARCGNTLFLADTNQLVRRYDTEARRWDSPIPSDRVGFPLTIVADCERGVLYSVGLIPLRATGGTPVYAISTKSLEREKTYELPRDFLPRPGGWVETGSLVLSGLWTRSDGKPQNQTTIEDFYSTTRLGLRLDLESGKADALLVPYETRCIGAGQCPEIRVDGITTGRHVFKVAALPVSTSVAVYDGERARLIDVTSRKFLRTGETLAPTTAPDVRMRWTGRNSTIDGVFAFESTIAVAHAQRRIEASWQFGSPAPTTTFLNTYSWTGTAHAVDYELPGVPIGRDEHAIYTVDYGPEGPREGALRLRISRVLVAP